LKEVLDPRPADTLLRPAMTSLAKRPDTVTGTLGLLDISKAGGSIFLDRIVEKLLVDFPLLKTERFIKPTFSKPAPDALRQRMKHCTMVVEALAD
jgi:hypothetical protein